MIESYQLEILRKRRAARLFWLVVFVCALFLYYFFQGYYPDVRVGMRRIFSESGTQSDSGASDLIKSFGIINVKTTPLDAMILLGSGTYGNNEKKMSDYGDYTMRITGSGYLTNTMEFQIDREKPFFIEKVSLLPIPSYRRLQGVQAIYQVNSDVYIAKTASGLVWSGSTASGRLSYSRTLEHIGGKYFDTDQGILSWETTRFIKANTDITNFVRTCPSVEWRYGLFSCPKTRSILTENGKYMTGILDIRNHLIERSGSIIEVTGGTLGKSWSQTGTVDLANIAIVDGVLYDTHTGTLTPRDPKGTIISTPLESIGHASSLEDDIILIGMRDGVAHLMIRHSGDPLDRTRNILLPGNLSYTDIEFHSLDGNIMITTPHGILFVYRGSLGLQWIVEGEILSYSKNGAAYRKDNTIWWVDWSEKI